MTTDYDHTIASVLRRYYVAQLEEMDESAKRIGRLLAASRINEVPFMRERKDSSEGLVHLNDTGRPAS